MKTLKCAAFGAAMLFGAVAAQAQEADEVRWRVPVSFGLKLVVLGETMPWVAQQLDRASGGRVKLEVAEAGTLIPALAVFDFVSAGKIEAGFSWMGYEIDKVPAAGLFGAVPFGMESAEFMAWMYFGGGNELLRDLFRPHNVHPILCSTLAPDGAGSFRSEINGADDIKGLRVRAASYAADVYRAAGAAVTFLRGDELFKAFESGALDAAEFSLPNVDEQLGIHRGARYYYLPGWQQPSTNQYLYVNLAAWNRLNATTRALIETSCTAGVAISLAKSESVQGWALEAIEKQGVQVRQMSGNLLAAFRAATRKVMAERAAADAEFKKIYDSQLAFMAQNDKWKSAGYLPRASR